MALTMDDRAELVLDAAWALLPPLKREILLEGIVIDDLGAVHGTYASETKVLTLSERLFWGENDAQILCIDIHGECPPQSYPLCSRALHTTIHELFHALGDVTGLDGTREWLRLSGWAQRDDDPVGTWRYYETRPGWHQERSEWRYRTESTWFAREYSTKSPYEDFADMATHVALGWQDFIDTSGQQKLAYLRKFVWEERGASRILAVRERWKRRLQGVG